MISNKVIDTLYKEYRKRPASPDELDIPLLFEKLPEEVGIEVDGNDIVINSLDAFSPFRRIPVSNIHAIVDFDEAVAIVMHSSIIFISKDDGAVHVHLRDIGMSLMDRLRSAFTPGEKLPV